MTLEFDREFLSIVDQSITQRLPQGVRFRTNRTATLLTDFRNGGPVRTTGTFIFNTRFFQEWSRDPAVVARMFELKNLGVAEAKRRVPVVTGNLRDSIGGTVRPGNQGILTIEITAGGPQAPYWAFVEYGTGSRGAQSRQVEPGRAPGYKYGAFPGQPAEPYLRPAMLTIRRRINQVQIRREQRAGP